MKIIRLLVRIHQEAYSRLGVFAAAAEGGLHPKHRLIQYHQFFVDNVRRGDTVLEVGCGNGALLREVALKTNALTIGIDIAGESVEAAKARLGDLSNVEIQLADVWRWEDARHFDTIILSNVLEHLEQRAKLLQRLVTSFRPRQILIRVPMFEREWLVPYKKELGIEWRLDPTHTIEYREEELKSELHEAGLELKELRSRWGEFYAVALPRGLTSW